MSSKTETRNRKSSTNSTRKGESTYLSPSEGRDQKEYPRIGEGR